MDFLTLETACLAAVAAQTLDLHPAASLVHLQEVEELEHFMAQLQQLAGANQYPPERRSDLGRPPHCQQPGCRAGRGTAYGWDTGILVCNRARCEGNPWGPQRLGCWGYAGMVRVVGNAYRGGCRPVVARGRFSRTQVRSAR